MTRSPWQLPFPPREVDVAIVGGGVIGCATASALRERRPDLRLALVEAHGLAHGASGRNAGFVLLGAPGADPGSGVPAERERAARLWAFTQENADAVRRLDAESPAFDLNWTGSVIAAGSHQEAEGLQRQAAVLDGVEWLEAGALHRRIGARSFVGGLYVEDGGTLDPAGLVRHLARRSGAAVVAPAPATAIEASGGGVRVETPAGTVRAEHAVVCLNAYLPRLLPAFAEWVRPVRAQMLATSPLAPALDVPVYSHDGYYYLRQRPDGRLLVGGARHLHREAEVGYDDATTSELQSHLEAYVGVHFPSLDVVRVERRWSGTMGFSPDGLPFVAAVPGVPGAVAAGGFTGHGMGYAVRFGHLLARRVLGEADPAADLFSAHRFSTFREVASRDLRAPEA